MSKRKKRRGNQALDGTVEQFVDDNSVRVNCKLTGKARPGWPAGTKTYNCKLSIHSPGSAVRRKGISVNYSQGPGIKDDPDPAHVLDAMRSDAQAVESSLTVEEFAREYGYDMSDPKARLRVHTVYRSVKANARKLRDVLGGKAYDELVNDTDPL